MAVSQSWAPGSYACGTFLAALVLAVVLIGFLVFLYMFLVKPEGALTVTYAYHPEMSAPARPAQIHSARVRAQGTRVHAQPTSSSVLDSDAELLVGTFVDPHESSGQYTRITVGDISGWVFSKALEHGTFGVALPTEKTCPRCAETVKIAAKVCRFCGFEFPTEAASDS